MIEVQIAPAPYVTIELFASISGLSEKAIRHRIAAGEWIEGREYRRAGGRILVSIEGYRKWVEMAPGSRSATASSASRSPSQAPTSATP